MRVYSIQPSYHYKSNQIKNFKQSGNSTNFEGLKGAGTGTVAGFVYGAALVGLASFVPGLGPIVAVPFLTSSSAVGALAGHKIEEASKNKKGKDD